MTSTTTTTTTASRPSTATTRPERGPRRKQEARTDIWTGLLRQTREAQARSRTLAVQARELLVCGGSAEDQRAFVQRLARPPPPPLQVSRTARDQRDRRSPAEVVLSNRFAYGYGHLTLYSPPPQDTGLLGGESEEVAKLGVHTVPEPDVGYEATLRRLLRPHTARSEVDETKDGRAGGEESENSGTKPRPAIAILLSWKQPWKFLELLRSWLQLLSRALLRSSGPQESPIEVLTEHRINLTVVVQHVEVQEQLERDNYREETFDYIAQCLRTCLLPLSAALIYTPSAPLTPANAQTAPLSEVQKVVYTSLGLDLSALSPAPVKTAGPSGESKKDDLLPKHNVVDRMAIVIPSAWDSVGKIRLLSESFSPEATIQGWLADIASPVIKSTRSPPVDQDDPRKADVTVEGETADGGAEQHTFESVGAGSPLEPSTRERSSSGPGQAGHSTIAAYDSQIQDPQAHRAAQPPRVEVTTKPEQEFLAEMRAQLQMLEEKDRERQEREPGAVATASSTSSGRGMVVPGGESSGALNSLGDVQFNVGGVNYNAATAEAAIERLRRPTPSESPRMSTPRPPKREDREGSRDTPRTAELDTDKLEEYFQSLMKRGGGGGGSAQSTPSRPSGSR